MNLIADGLLIATALTAAIYCHVLARRLRRLGNLDEGLGARIGALDSTLNETRAALAETQQRIEQIRSGATSASERLKRDITKAKQMIEELEAISRTADEKLKRLFEIGHFAECSEERIEVVSSAGLDMVIRNPTAAVLERGGLAVSPNGERQPSPLDNVSVRQPEVERTQLQARLPKVGRIDL